MITLGTARRITLVAGGCWENHFLMPSSLRCPCGGGRIVPARLQFPDGRPLWGLSYGGELPRRGVLLVLLNGDSLPLRYLGRRG